MDKAPNQNTKKCAASGITPALIRIGETVTATTIYSAVEGRPILSTIHTSITTSRIIHRVLLVIATILNASVEPIPVMVTTQMITPMAAQATVT
ncbi:hypothetical protein D3C72_1881490 [compost metagenome]